MHPIWHPYTVQKSDLKEVHIAKAQSEFLYDIDGNSYIDAIASWWTSIHGHNHPFIVEAIVNQLQSLDHTILAGFVHTPAQRLAEKLIEFTDNHFYKVFYSDNGSCAVEVAIKIAIQHFKNQNINKTKIIHFSSSYHGDTIGAMSVGGDSAFNENFRTLFFDSPVFDAPDCYSCSWSSDKKRCKNECLEKLKFYFQREHNSIAAIILEPLIFGASGMKMYKEQVLLDLRTLCDKYNILLILDEVFTGFGRTGEKFAFMKAKIEPDIIAIAKGLTGGILPFAATLVTKKVYDPFYSDDVSKAFLHGHTMTGNPLASAAAIASIELFEKENRLAMVCELEKEYREFGQILEKKFPEKVKNIRFLGSVFAFELNQSASYLTNLSRAIFQNSLENGVILRPLGSTIYLTPPYTIQKNSLHKIFETILKLNCFCD